MSSSIKYQLSDGTEIFIDSNFLGEGGEGGVYAIISPTAYKASVAKILFPDKRNDIEHRYRIDYMIKNPPNETKDSNGHSFLIWPEKLLFENGNFAGFLMPKAEGVILEELSSTELGFYSYPKHNDRLGVEWLRFDRQNDESTIIRLKLCSNIAKAVHALHQTGKYVIGDLKPGNIMVQPNGLVSILDLDSCQILENNKIRFKSKMNTPEFNPPEQSTDKKETYWDLFILGIIFYRVLCGIHPFSGTCKPPYQDFTLPELKIKEGLFPFGVKGFHFDVIPTAHNTFSLLPEYAQKLFIRCFEDGIFHPKLRPTTFDWINQLTAKPVIKDFSVDKDIIFNTQHFTLSWATENGKSAEIEGNGNVPLSGYLKLATSNKSMFKLVVSNDFGFVSQELILTIFPTPILESLKVPMPVFESNFSLSPITIESPEILSINFESTNISKLPDFISLNHKLQNVNPMYKSDSLLWGISKVFKAIKDRLI
jgi:serine/threonine protein kinase